MTIEERMERLERQNTTLAYVNRRLRLAVVGLAVAAGLGVLVGTRSQDPQEMILRKLVIVDEEGRERIVLNGKDDRNAASIRWWDEEGKMRIRAQTRPDGIATVNHLDKGGKVRISAVTRTDGIAAVVHYDNVGEERIRIKTRPDGVAGVSLYDKDGTERVVAWTLADGTAETVGYDK